MSTRTWLKQNGYEDVADLIDGIMNDWKKRRVRTRRNWWAVLAGAKNGSPVEVNGVEFPLLKSAQRHQGVPITQNAIQRNKSEDVPRKSFHGKSLIRVREKIKSKASKSNSPRPSSGQ